MEGVGLEEDVCGRLMAGVSNPGCGNAIAQMQKKHPEKKKQRKSQRKVSKKSRKQRK